MAGRVFQILCLLLAATVFSACAKISTTLMPERGAFVGPTGTGTVGLALWSGTKCQAILDWVDIFRRAYPGHPLNFERGPYKQPPPFAILFVEDTFEAAFGNPYTKENEEKFKKIYRTTIGNCRGEGKTGVPFYRDQFVSLYGFLSYTFMSFQHGLVDAARTYTSIQNEVPALMDQLEKLPLSQGSYQHLINSIIPEYTAKLSTMPYKLRKDFDEAAAAKQKAIARHVLETDFADLENAPNNMDTVARLKQAMPYADLLIPDNDSLALRFHQRKRDIIEASIAEYRSALQAIPFTVEGRAQSLVWRQRFDMVFDKSLEPGALALGRDWVNQRNAIYMATKDDFMKKMEELPAGPRTRAAYERLLMETFPRQEDRLLPAYQDYRRETLKRQKAMLERAVESTTDTVTEGIDSLRKILKETAKDLVR